MMFLRGVSDGKYISSSMTMPKVVKRISGRASEGRESRRYEQSFWAITA